MHTGRLISCCEGRQSDHCDLKATADTQTSMVYDSDSGTKMSLRSTIANPFQVSMIVSYSGQPVHLSYCTNIHAGDAWHDVFPTLQKQLPRVRAALGEKAAMGIGLRLSRSSLDTLEGSEALADFRNWLATENFYVYTINGFPYGRFHGERVKEDVYKPDWTEQSRVDYTCRLADLLCELSPPENYGSISTLPGTYKNWIMPGTVERISENLIKAVAHCVRLKQHRGITIALALEPEPCCLLETVAETVSFFKQHLFTDQAVTQLKALCGINTSAAESALREHIGVCYDVCHSAVEFEDPVKVISQLRSAEIEIVKIQLSSALEIDRVNEESLSHLSRFDEPVYLHQVIERRDKTLTVYNDVRAAMTAFRNRFKPRSQLHPTLQMTINGDTGYPVQNISEPDTRWRIHYHVPVFIQKTDHFLTTQSSLAKVLSLQKQSAVSRHLEVETYTWDVLPEQYRQQSVSDAIANEIRWIRERL
ncbi:MAG: metabolite traffic protein EboE [Granulosicoccus sp.]